MTTVTSSPSHSPRPFSKAPSPQFFYRSPTTTSIPSPTLSGALPSGSSTSVGASSRRRPYTTASASPRSIGFGRASSTSPAQPIARDASSAAKNLDSEKVKTSSSSADVVASSFISFDNRQGKVEERGLGSEYVDSGTQYSPAGYPPTTDQDLLRLRGHIAGSAEAPALSRLDAGGNSRGKKSVRQHNEEDQDMQDIFDASTSNFISSRGSGLSGMETTMTTDGKDEKPEAPNNGGEDVEMGDAPPETTESSQSSIFQHKRAATPSSLSSGSLLVPLSPLPTKRSRPESIPSTWKVLPRDYMKCSPADLGVIIADMLNELIQINDDMPPKDSLTRFHSRAPPAISVRDYLDRLIFHATLSQPILLAMVFYIDRLCLLYPAFTITSLTVHRFLITAATVAAKGLCDSFWTNHTYARVGGVSPKELAMLELEFLRRLDWSIVPPPDMLDDYYRSLVGRAEGYVLEGEEGIREGQ